MTGNSGTARCTNWLPALLSRRVAAASPLAPKISPDTGLEITSFAVIGGTSPSKPTFASKISGEVLMTRDSGTFQFLLQFFWRGLELRNLVAKQQIEEIGTADAKQLSVLAGRDAALFIPFDYCRFKQLSGEPTFVAAKIPHHFFRQLNCHSPSHRLKFNRATPAGQGTLSLTVDSTDTTHCIT